MDVARFDFTLPDRLVALRPAVPRESARLMTVPADGPVGHRRIDDLPCLLRAADGLVVNDTRVIPARLRGRRRRQSSDVAIEVLLHRRLGAARWLAFARPGKRLAVGDRIAFGPDTGDLACQATVEEKAASGEIDIVFDKGGADLDAAIAVLGEMPLPPYIESRRPSDAADRTDYQTVYAREPGAVAAPTAGLHLTEGLLARLGETGLSRHAVTLHVGAGTFLPVKTEDTADHRMHAEWGEVTAAAADALNAVRATGGRIVAIGTTALRLLESATDPDGVVKPFRGETEIFITPGYRFRAVDALLTNFHLPRSTLFMLVSAFAGLDRMQAAYGEAIAAGYRFYSYGDACLIERAEPA